MNGELAPVSQAEFSQEGGNVALDSPIRNEQPIADLSVAEAFPHEFENLGLAGRRGQLHEVHCGPHRCEGRQFTHVLLACVRARGEFRTHH
jgi:hypothetical protein